MGDKFRNELKYIVTNNELEVVGAKLKHLLQMDPYVDQEIGYYVVKSLYFDDYEDNCFHNNEFSLGRRKKYRIRIYGNESDFMLLEKKEKENSRSKKTSYKLSRAEYNKLFYADVSELYWNATDALLKEFALQMMMNRFTPKVIIKYERTPFIHFPGNVRVTLDRNISASGEIDRFLDHSYTVIPVIEEGYHLLEVKFDEFLPEYIKQIIQLDTLEQATFSKYYLGRETSMNHGGI